MPKEASSAGQFVIGPRGIIEDVDAAACALLGYARADLIGRHGSELVPHEAQPATAATIDRMRHGDFRSGAGRLLHHDGSILDVDVSVRRLRNGRLALRVRRR